jgi:hypothetical protein
VSIRIKKRKTFKKVEQDEESKEVGTPAYRLRERIQVKYKIPLPKNPFGEGEHPVMPLDIVSLTDQQLSRLYGQLSVLASYVHDTAATYDVEYIFMENNAKEEDVLERLRLADESDNKIPKHIKEDMAFMAREARVTRAAKLERKAMFKILGARLEGIERNIRALSREQTRREKDHERRIGHQT